MGKEFRKMERLTGEYTRWNCACRHRLFFDVYEIADRLAIIEDILGDDYDLDRLRELKQADDEGRCVVLPSGDYTDKDGENALKSAMNTCFYHNNPVTRYIADAVAEKLTREEAEAALKEAEPSGT
nr:MAG TPA: hypothetical protein [Caudoviricetes sp.]